MKSLLFASVGIILMASIAGAQCSTAGLIVTGSKSASKCYGSLATFNSIYNKASIYYDYEFSSFPGNGANGIACEYPVYNNDAGTFYGRQRTWNSVSNSSCTTLVGCPSPASGNETIYATYGTNSSGCLSNILMEACPANGTSWMCAGTGLPTWTAGSPPTCGSSDATFHVPAPVVYPLYPSKGNSSYVSCNAYSVGMYACNVPFSISGPVAANGIYGDTPHLGSGGLIKGYKMYYRCTSGSNPDCQLANWTPVSISSPYIAYAGASTSGTITAACPDNTDIYLAYQYIFNNRAGTDMATLDAANMKPMQSGASTGAYPYLSPWIQLPFGVICPLGPTSIFNATDNDYCATSGITITGGNPDCWICPEFYYLLEDGVIVGHSGQYSPGDSASHSYTLEASSCGLTGSPSAAVVIADSNLYPGNPVITNIADVNVCAQNGIQIAYTAGAGASGYYHNLYKDGQLAVSSYHSGATYNPGDTVSHTYIVLAPGTGYNSSCVKSSPGVIGTDVNNTPTAASGPSPADTATGVSNTPVLSWQAAANAQSYDVYFGSSNPPAFAVNVTGTSYSPGALGGSTAYYWKIVSKNNTCGNASGSAVWSFTTGAVSPAPGTVAPGSGGGSLAKSGSNILLNWSGARNTCSPTTWEIYRGTLGNYYSHVIAACDTSGANNWTEINGLNDSESYYYLIVPATTAKEGSYGKDSTGIEIPQASTACLPQDLTGCN